MSKEITINLSDEEYKAMTIIAYDPIEWVQNVTQVRARAAIEEITNNIIQEKLENGEPIQGTKNEIFMNAEIPTAKEETDAEEERMLNSDTP